MGKHWSSLQTVDHVVIKAVNGGVSLVTAFSALAVFYIYGQDLLKAWFTNQRLATREVGGGKQIKINV